MFTRSQSTCGMRRNRHSHPMNRGSAMSSGNTVFDAYRAETLRRLEEEQNAFESFLQRLRDAKDKQEFDAFMADRARAAQMPAAPDAPDAPRV